MRKLFVSLLVIAMLAAPVMASANSLRVRGYSSPQTGKYVMPYYRTTPNRYKFDNWSSRGNMNPFTGKRGYRSW